MSNVIAGPAWIEDRSNDVIDAAWVSANAARTVRTAQDARVFQAEEHGEMRLRLEQMIGAAREVVMMSSFLFADPNIERALLDAARRGVRVYLLVASEAKLAAEVRADDLFGQETVEDHKRLLDALAGWVYVRSAEFFHAKFVLVDPKTQPRGMLLTANITKDALTRNHELGVYLASADVQALASLFTWAFWEAAQRELLGAGSLPPVGAAKRIELPAPVAGIVATAGARRDLRAAVLRLIRAATRTLVLAIYGISDAEVIEALAERVRKGVSVVLLVRHPRVGMFDTLCTLARAGVRIAGVSKWLHAKALLVDGTRAMVMTANCETHGLDDGFEVGVELAGNDAAALGRMLAAWHSSAVWHFRVDMKVGELGGMVQVLTGKGYKDVSVEPNGRIHDGTVKVDSCTKIGTATRPRPAMVPDGKRYHRIEHSWSVELPMLARNAKPWLPPKEKDKPSLVLPFPVFEEGGGRRVFAIQNVEQLEAAQRVMGAFGVNAIVLRSER
ncbi:MAG TPA: phospholipase D-like domain-containing protein [Polyangium sp.]|nr:phospholipase D-like domain-containing protein [Polyangium sp.]